jgi:aldose sugar dehydrogenase
MFFLILCLFTFLTYAHGISKPVFRTTAQNESGQTIIDPTLKVEKVFEGKGFFSAMAFLGPNDILVVDKNYGTVNRIINGTLLKHPLLDVNVSNRNERGMTGIAVASKHGNIENHYNGSSNVDKYVYLYFTEAKSYDGDDRTGNKPLGNRLYRYDLINDTKLGNGRVLLEVPALPGPSHNGGAIAIGPDRNLYIIIGNINSAEIRSFWTTAENFENRTGPDGRAGILRLTLDGEPVNKHGILGDSMPLKLYYAYGIRNGFGLAFDPVTGKLWDTENGPDYGDEINLVNPGFNSGWHKLQGVWERTPGYGTAGGVLLNPQNLVDFNGKGKYSPPEFMWYKTVGVTGLAFLNSDKLGEQYKNDLFVGAYHTGTVYHFDLNKSRKGLADFNQVKDNISRGHEDLRGVTFGAGFGGITDLKVGPDGYLYVLSHLTGGSDCNPKFPKEPCVPYSAPNVSNIFKIHLR